MMIRLRQLAHLADPALIRWWVILLGVDLFFIAVFTVRRIYVALNLNPDHPIVTNDGWNIGRDGSYAEMLGYAKTAVIILILTSIPGKGRRPIYLALILIFIIVLLDDSLQLHEGLGMWLGDELGLESSLGRLSGHIGEVIVWAISGIVLLAVAGAAFVKSPQVDRANGLLFLGAFAVLVLFAVVADLAHTLVKHKLGVPGGDLLFTVIEDGGEQIAFSLILGLTLLVRRQLRVRDGA